MKKVTRLFWALALCSVAVVGCSKDNEGDNNGDNGGGNDTSWNPITATITGTVSSDIDSVYGMVYYGENRYGVALVGAKFADNKFTMTLPENVDAQYLNNIADVVVKGVSISDTSTKATSLSFRAWSKGYGVGNFHYTNMTVAEFVSDVTDASVGKVQTEFIYVDRDCNVTGNFQSADFFGKGIQTTINMNLPLKKGWNRCVITMKSFSSSEKKATLEYTTTIPSEMKWIHIQ